MAVDSQLTVMDCGLIEKFNEMGVNVEIRGIIWLFHGVDNNPVFGFQPKTSLAGEDTAS